MKELDLVINWYMKQTPLPPPQSFIFLTFAPIFSLFSVAYLEFIKPRLAISETECTANHRRYCHYHHHPLVSLAVEAINAVFYFAGFIALAVFLSHIGFCNGTVCATGRATSPVAATEFISWITTTILLAKDIFKERTRGSALEGERCVEELCWERSDRGTMAPEMEQLR